MTDILIDEVQDAYFTGGYIADNLPTRPIDSAFHCITQSSQMAPVSDFSHSSISHQNALGLYQVSRLGFDQAAALARAYMGTSDQTGAPFFDTSFLPQSDFFDDVWPLPHCQSMGEEVALGGVGEHFVSHPFHSTPLPAECHSTRRPNAQFPGKRHNASRSLSEPTPPRPPRHTPYPISTRRRTVPASVYQCQWFDGATPCGELLMGTKGAIAKHFEKAHALRLKADKTELACRWGMCGKMMQRESMARHILAVHMQNKVFCPTCKSRFARTDSLQRHQRTQLECLAEAETVHAGNLNIGQ